MRSRVAVFVLQAVAISAVSLALLEMLVAVSFAFPSASPIPLAELRYLHVQLDRNTIQMMPDCAVYDDRLTYRLRPGRCTFSNREFSHEYRINSLGVRDDETSLHGPEIVMLGDSLTMGWGVGEEESFASLFENSTGRRTLNAGISSYGTVRELRLLERVDRTRLEHLVLQYSDNDFAENGQFVDSPEFTVLTRAQYDRTVEYHRQSLRYFPGKYALNLLVRLRNLVGQRGGESESPDPSVEAEVFLEVLRRSPVDLSAFRITVLSLHSRFIEAARPAAAAAAEPWLRSIQFLDVSDIAGIEGAFYVLDDHPTSVGHRAMAAELVRALRPVHASREQGAP